MKTVLYFSETASFGPEGDWAYTQGVVLEFDDVTEAVTRTYYGSQLQESYSEGIEGGTILKSTCTGTTERRITYIAPNVLQPQLSVQVTLIPNSPSCPATPPPPPPPRWGCTDPKAQNYDPLAVNDDGSCTYAPVQSQQSDPAYLFEPLDEEFLVREPLTISYQVQFQSWTSFHDYHPVMWVQRGRELFLHRKDSPQIHRANAGPIGSFMGLSQAKASLEVVFNPEPSVEKTFDSLSVVAYKGEGHVTDAPEDDLDSFSMPFAAAEFRTSRQHSGACRLVEGVLPGEEEISAPGADPVYTTLPAAGDVVRVKRVRREWRMAVPRDVVIDPLLAPHLASNQHAPAARGGLLLPRMRDRWMSASFSTDGKEPSRQCRIFALSIRFRPVAR